MKSNLFLAIRTTLRNKKIIILIFLISTILLFGTIISTYQKSLTEHINNYSTSMYESLMYTVGKKNSTYEEKEQELKSIDHISYVSREYDVGTFTLSNQEWHNSKVDGDIWVYVANNNTLPKIVKGSNYMDEEQNYLVCPEILYPSSSLNDTKEAKKISKKDGIKMNKYLDKVITFEEEVLNEEGTYTKKEVKAKIVGLYKVNQYDIKDNTCYGNISLRKETYENYYENANKENYEYIPNPSSALIIIDNYDNSDKVIEELNRLGYNVEPYAEYDPETLETLNNNSKIFSIIILIVCLILISVFLLRNTISRKEEYKVYKYLGYTNQNILILIILSNIVIMTTSLLLSLVLSIAYKVLLQVIVSFYPFYFSKMEVLLSTKNLFIVFGLSLLWSIMNSIINSLFITGEKS